MVLLFCFLSELFVNVRGGPTGEKDGPTGSEEDIRLSRLERVLAKAPELVEKLDDLSVSDSSSNATKMNSCREVVSGCYDEAGELTPNSLFDSRSSPQERSPVSRNAHKNCYASAPGPTLDAGPAVPVAAGPGGRPAARQRDKEVEQRDKWKDVPRPWPPPPHAPDRVLPPGPPLFRPVPRGVASNLRDAGAPSGGFSVVDQGARRGQEVGHGRVDSPAAAPHQERRVDSPARRVDHCSPAPGTRSGGSRSGGSSAQESDHCLAAAPPAQEVAGRPLEDCSPATRPGAQVAWRPEHFGHQNQEKQIKSPPARRVEDSPAAHVAPHQHQEAPGRRVDPHPGGAGADLHAGAQPRGAGAPHGAGAESRVTSTTAQNAGAGDQDRVSRRAVRPAARGALERILAPSSPGRQEVGRTPSPGPRQEVGRTGG